MNQKYDLIAFILVTVGAIGTTDSIARPVIDQQPVQQEKDQHATAARKPTKHRPVGTHKDQRKLPGVGPKASPTSPPQPPSIPKVEQKMVPVETKQTIVESELYEIDSIQAVVFADESCRVICHSDVTRPAIDGTQRSCQDMVIEQLMYDDGKKYKIVPDEDAIDKHLKTVQRENNLSQQDMELIFKRAGYSYEEGRQEFARMTTVNSVAEFKLGAKRSVVPEAKVKEYYEQHPAYQEAAYELQRAFVPFKIYLSNSELRADIVNGYEPLRWEAGFWIEHEQVAEDKQFIYTMNIGDISEPLETDEGFELFRLKDKRERRLLTLDERRMEIVDTLRRPQFEAALNDYKKELLDNAAVLYFNN